MSRHSIKYFSYAKPGTMGVKWGIKSLDNLPIFVIAVIAVVLYISSSLIMHIHNSLQVTKVKARSLSRPC